MTALIPCPFPPSPTRTEVELFLKQRDQPQLEALLRIVQFRLGTPAERLGDVERAQLIAHQLNNVLTAQRIKEALLRLDEGESKA